MIAVLALMATGVSQIDWAMADYARCKLIHTPFEPLLLGSKDPVPDTHTTITMRRNRVLIIRSSQPEYPDEPDKIRKPGDDNYKWTLDWVGDLKPGETKRMNPDTTVKMGKDGSIILHTSGLKATTGSWTIEPGTSDYNDYIKKVHGIRPGQTKRVPASVGRVYMLADGTVELRDHELTDPPMVAHPEDKNYQRILSLVGPLKPGDYAYVDENAVDECGYPVTGKHALR